MKPLPKIILMAFAMTAVILTAYSIGYLNGVDEGRRQVLKECGR